MKKWNDVSRLIMGEEKVLSGRNSATELKKLYDKKQAFIHVVNDEIVGLAALFPTAHKEWKEIGSMFVRKDYRGKKISSALFHTCFDSVAKDLHVLLVTHHDKVIHLAGSKGLTEATCTKSPDIPDKIICDPCDRIPHHEKHMCPFRSKRNKCAVFYR